METLEFCPLCGSSNFKAIKRIIDYSTTSEEFSVCKCYACSLLFTNPRPDQRSIGAYYNSPAYISHSNETKGLFAATYQAIRKQAIKKKFKWIKPYLNNEATILDYGSGTGEFLNYCKTQGLRTVGVEIAETARQKAISNYNLHVLNPERLNEIEPASVDLVTMWHVLEHLPDLSLSVDRITNKLTPNGFLVIAVPNHESYDANLYEEYWAAWDVPIHFYHFSKESMGEFAKRHALELKQIIPMPFDAYYISLLSEQYKTGHKRWLKALYNGFVSNRQGIPIDNTSSLTYIFKKLNT